MSGRKNALTWDLESIFPGGSASTEFAEFRQAITTDLHKARATLQQLPRTLDEGSTGKWVAFFLLVQHLEERISHAHGFAGCLMGQDVKDEKARLIEDEIASQQAVWEVIMTGIEDFATGVDDAAWENLLRHEKLSETRFFWNELRRNARLKMKPHLEKLATELAVNGYHAWNRLYTKMAGDLKTEFTENGKTETLSMGQLATRFSSPDRDVRKRAFEALEATWKKVETLAGLALNAQAGFRLSLYENRGWESVLFEPLLNGRLKEETIEAMWSSVARGAARMAEFIRAKSKFLGIDRFRWYDQVAPVATVERKIEYTEASDFVVKHLSSFSPEMGDFARMVIDRRWIEAEDRAGKAAGGWCTGLPMKKESRIFMTYSGNYEEVMTLAHEIGHAYHSWVLRDRDYFARQYNMNLAETASTFNELLVTDAALAAANDPAEKLSLLDSKIQEGFIMFCNIRARFLFDCAFYEERKKGSVSTERLSELMVEAQRSAFAGILADDGYHPLFWASKLHFYETEMPFYNFPYTFGYLFSGGVYDRARKEGAAFAHRYKAFLSDTGSMTTEEVADKHLGVDLTDQTFWDDAVGRVVSDIDEFVVLAGESTTDR